MRIACLQFAPTLKSIADNQRRADALLEQQLRRGDVDVLLLPEMAFTGYCFQGQGEILPYCESARDGPTAQWCLRTAQAQGCIVLAGFPERDGEHLYNSLLVADPGGGGRIVHVARKHFLYMTDETWAREGPGFTRCDLPGLGRCALGICMDLNPKQFKAPFDRFEFASALFDPPLAHHERARKRRLAVDLVLLCNNWLKAGADVDIDDDIYCQYLVNYWASRLEPALGLPVLVAVANRVGVERGVHFAGCSCVIDLGTRTLLGRLDGREEGILVVDTK